MFEVGQRIIYAVDRDKVDAPVLTVAAISPDGEMLRYDGSNGWGWMYNFLPADRPKEAIDNQMEALGLQ